MTSIFLPIHRAIVLPQQFSQGGGGGGTPLGTPTYIDKQVTQATGDVTIFPPALHQNGDLLVAFHATSNTQIITTPATWNLGLNAGDRLRMYWKYANNEPVSYIWDSSASNVNVVGILAYRDLNGSGPADGSPTTSSGNDDLVTATGLTTTSDKTLLIMGVWGSGSRTFNDGSSSLGNDRIDWIQENGSGITLGVFDGVQTVAGPTGNETVVMNSSTGFNCILVAFKPSGA